MTDEAVVEPEQEQVVAPMLDPTWTPEAGYSHAEKLMRLHGLHDKN